VTRQPEQIKAFRDTWELGIHSYLSYLRDRLTVARELLTDSGSCFVQIGDENQHLVRNVLDEVFGSDNFVSLVTCSKTTGSTGDLLPGTADYIIWYAKDRGEVKFRRLFSESSPGPRVVPSTRRSNSLMAPAVRSQSGRWCRPALESSVSTISLAKARAERRARGRPPEGKAITPTMQSRWKTNEEGMRRLVLAGRVAASGRTLSYVRYIDDFPAFPISNTWMDIGGIQSRADPKVYVVQTATTAVQRCMLMTTDPGDLALDPTCGSGTTAYVAEQWGRRWITIDTSRVALALARTRLMCARFPYYLLADSPEGAAKEAEITGHRTASPTFADDVKKGFVFRRVPHVTLKSIAQNPDIAEGMSRNRLMPPSLGMPRASCSSTSRSRTARRCG
jgi:adenine-specific DNA-methyltransferase